MVITGTFDVALVILSAVIAVAASFTALDLAGRIHASAGAVRRAWLVAAAIAMGGGIWSMHFVAMLAFRMPMPVAYDVGITLLSLLVAIVVTGAGFVIISRPEPGRRGIVLGGLFMGAGICAMHYLGMDAMRMAADISYDWALVALSFVIAAGASMAALRLALSTMNLRQRAAAAGIMGLAISGMHYTGMAAANFTMSHQAGAVSGLSSLAQENLALAVAVTTFFILFLAAISAIADRRIAAREAAALRANEERYRHLYEALQREIAQREHVEAALRHIQKMEAVGQLTGGIAHDFNNILTVVIGNLDALSASLPDDKDFRRMIEAAMRGAQRAASLTHRLLAFGRQQILAPKTVNASRLLTGTTEVLSRTLGEAIAIETIIPGQLWPCFVDPNQLEAALINLALNARDAMPTGGKLTMQTANMHFDESYTARYEGIAPGDYVMIAVSDTGIGIPKDDLPKVFEPFFTTKEVGKGSGLGLAQVYGFVKQSGGHVTIYSELGVGTTVRLYLRRQTVTAEPSTAPVRSRETPRARPGEKVLVVEDDGAVRDYSARTLAELGYTVIEAEDAEAALAIVEERHDIDLIFTDIGLPGMNGTSFASAARERRRRLKVLYTTGYAGAALTEDGSLGRGAAVLQKPFSREALAESIRAVLDGCAPVS